MIGAIEHESSSSHASMNGIFEKIFTYSDTANSFVLPLLYTTSSLMWFPPYKKTNIAIFFIIW